VSPRSKHQGGGEERTPSPGRPAAGALLAPGGRSTDGAVAGRADGRSERARQLRVARRSRILEAALRVFARSGFHVASVDDIVREAGVARGTFYLYFPSKQELLGALLDELTTDLEGTIRRVDLSPGAPSPMDQLLANVVGLLALTRARPEMLQILLWESIGIDEALDRKLDSFHRRMFSLMQRSLNLGVEMGLVRACDTTVVARLLVGSVKELMFSLLVRGDLRDAPLEDLGRELLSFCMRGILSDGGSAPSPRRRTRRSAPDRPDRH
jgi:TetR/AcrR family fatty acid metabolism transcriptional regulator